jgi:hypothetical protein
MCGVTIESGRVFFGSRREELPLRAFRLSVAKF